MAEPVQLDSKIDNAPPDALSQQIKRLETVRDITAQLAATLDLKPLLTNLVTLVHSRMSCERVVVTYVDDEGTALKYGASSIPLPSTVDKMSLENASLSIFNAASDTVIGTWVQGKPMTIESENAADSKAIPLLRMVELKSAYSVPLNLKDRLAGVLFVEPKLGEPLSDDDKALLETISTSLAVAVENARLHSQTVEKLKTNVQEMNMLQQIDRELNDTISLELVFNMALDWALRFSNAHAASLALYNEKEDKLHIISHYGYEVDVDELEKQHPNLTGGITYRVAQSGRTEIIPDISLDPNYIQVANNIRSQMAAPVMREERVVAVITLESKKLNGFNDDHIEFVLKLATRAAVAIDNARLFNETVREREKLSYILSNIGDVVIVIGLDDSVMLISQSAISALRLYTDKNYVNKPFNEIFEHTPLLEIYKRARTSQEGAIEEIELPNGRAYHTNISYHEGIGYIIVLQDITPFKEMDKLKNEIIATVSHDLKQPLSVMTGYLDLLEMKNKFDEQSSNFVNMIDRSIRNMRQLIDDLLDLAKIESGVDLKLSPVDIKTVLGESIEAVKPSADIKNMTITTELPDALPPVRGELARLRQIFDNLISNAVKYTPPDGKIKVTAESRGLSLRVSVQDNGLGISPEDQAHIFDRFYRVRRPETDSIDGTGLGLAIVKTLVEAHHGKIGLESKLGEGSTFYVTLPTEIN
jgi:signal transduction histidine kinase